MLYSNYSAELNVGMDVAGPLLLMLALFALGVPIWVSLGLTGLAMLWFTGALPLSLLGESLFNGVDAFALIAIPLYLLTGDALVQDHAGKQPRIRAELWPRPETADYGIRGDLSELNGLPVLEQEELPATRRQPAKFVDVISAAMLRNMQRDDGIVIFGEDVHRLRGGTAGATRNIGQQYPDRLIGTPICENGFTGLALGAALNGLRPVVEIMYPDFSLVAADQLFNQIAKVRHMFGGEFPVPVLVRSRMSAGTGYGSQHSMDAAGLFALYPGWRIVAPSRPHDYIGLLNAALRCHDPVLIVEYQDLFRNVDDVPADEWDYIVPFGKARIARPGQARPARC